jgi:drug/metabolite transporter (DMT)-like permease
MNGKTLSVPMLAALVTVLLWAGSFIAIRVGVGEMSPAELASARFAIAGCAGALWLTFASTRRPNRDDFPRIVLCALVGIALYNVVLGAGQQHVSAGVASFIVATQTLFTALLSWSLDGIRPTVRFVTGCAVSTLGLAVIGVTQSLSGSVEGFGLCIAAAALSGSYFVIQRPLVVKLGPISAASATLLGGGLMLVPWLPSAVAIMQAEPETLAPVLYLGVLASVVAYSTWMVAIDGLGPARAAQTLFLMAPAAAVMEWTSGLAPFEGIVAAGGVISLVGVVIANRRFEPEKSK